MITTNTTTIIVDSEYKGFQFIAMEAHKLPASPKGATFVTIAVNPSSECKFTICEFETLQEMIDNTVWSAWRLQGIKDKELAKKLSMI